MGGVIPYCLPVPEDAAENCIRYDWDEGNGKGSGRGIVKGKERKIWTSSKGNGIRVESSYTRLQPGPAWPGLGSDK